VSADPGGAGTAARTVGRPRDPALDVAILDAAVELLVEEGFEGMSIEAVAHRAGVGKPTIYRRWPSKEAMVIDALERLSDRPEVPPEGTVRERLTGFMERWWHLAGRGDATRPTRLLASLVGEIQRGSELGEAVRRAFVQSRRRRLIALLREGVRSGELRGDVDVDLAADLLFGPLLVRKMLSGGRISADAARHAVDVLFDGWGVRR
jgi:AcrR family transcriptional regulator